MPRSPRYYFPGAIYHILLRGNNKRPIFQSDAEHCRFLQLLQEGTERFDHEVFAFCLMTNHVHLAVRVNGDHPSKIFQHLASSYTRYFHWKHETSGHLFQGRFKSIPVDGSAYFRALIRYIHLNPVKAGMVSDPKVYRWSSHQAYLHQSDYPWLSRDFTMEHFGTPEALDRFVMAGVKEKDPVDFTKGIAGGKAFTRFVKEGQEQSPPSGPSVESLVATVSELYGVEPEDLRHGKRDAKSARLRAVASFLVREVQGIALQDLAAFFGRDVNSIYKAASRLARKMDSSSTLRAEIQTLREKLLPQS